MIIGPKVDHTKTQNHELTTHKKVLSKHTSLQSI